jgi:uncharacterized membrane protein HdeD (DUF308 family)
MNETFEKRNYWWVPLLSGLILLFFGIWFIASPLENFKTLTVVFGVIVFLSGVFELYIAFRNRNAVVNQLSFVWGGILNLVLGGLLMVNPGALLFIISLIIAFFLIFIGGEQIKRAINLQKRKSENWKLVLIFGILLILFAAVLLWRPEIIGFTLAVWTSIAFILTGIFRIYLAFRLRKLG